MEPASLIVGALAAGAAVAAKDVGKSVVKDSYDGLKQLVVNLFKQKKNDTGEMAVEKFESKPEVWKGPLEDALAETGADMDENIIKAARQLMELIEPKQAAMGKFNVQAKNVQGVVQAEKIDSLTQNFGKS